MFLQAEGNEVKLYGTIWSGDGQYIVNELAPILKKNTDTTVRLHTPGGSVFDGNLIFNSLAQSKSNIHIIIDGLAASMGSILMLAGNKVSIAENAFIMIHAPSGGAQGGAKDFTNIAKLLTSLESNFIKKYASKTGKPSAEIAAWMQGDNWFSAEEALAAGLVDEIIDPVIENLDINAYTEFNMVALAKAFEPYDIKQVSPTEQEKKVKTKKTNTEMKLNAKSLEVLGVSEGATDEQINAAIESNNQKRLEAELKLKAVNDKQVETLISTAVSEGRILASEKDEYRELAVSNFDLASKTIAKLPIKKNIIGALDRENKGDVTGREKWSFTDWSKNDTRGLLEMKVNDPEAYKELAEKSGIKL